YALAERRAGRAGHVLLALVLAELAVGLGLVGHAGLRPRRVRLVGVDVAVAIAMTVRRLCERRRGRQREDRRGSGEWTTESHGASLAELRCQSRKREPGS